MRTLAWIAMLAGAVLVVISGSQTTTVNTVLLIAAIVLLVVGLMALFPDDALADHPEESQADLDEARRRRGAAGWQKPVAPPRLGSRPGGLPARRRRDG